MQYLKKYLWDIQPWEQRVMNVIAAIWMSICSVVGWIWMFGG